MRLDAPTPQPAKRCSPSAGRRRIAGLTLNLSPRGDLIEAAANLFAHLRALDAPAPRRIAVMTVPHDGLGEAINDRLRAPPRRRQ